MSAFYAGLDVSDRTTAICVVDSAGEIILECTADTTPAAISRQLAPYRRVLKTVAHESGSKAPWLQKELLKKRLPVVCVDARKASAVLKLQRNKTDKKDARCLALLVRTGWCEPANTRSDEAYRLGLLLTHRRQMMRKALSIDLCLRSSLKVFGGYVEKGERVTLPGRRKDEAIDALGDSMIRARNALKREVKKLDSLVLKTAKADPVCRRLMTIPGVGPITSLTFRATVDNPHRFSNSRNVAASFGLTPKRFQSGQTDRQGRISREGDANMRTALYEAATSMLMKSRSKCALRAWGLRILKRKGQRIAAIAVARKLAVVMHRMWLSGQDFDPSPERRVGGPGIIARPRA